MDNFLIPNHYLTKNERKSSKGKIYWLGQHKKEFCKLYLNVDYNSIDRHQLHFFMYNNRGGLDFDNNGFPIWKYTNEPIKLIFN